MSASLKLVCHKELLRNNEANRRLEIEMWLSCKSSSESTGFKASTRLDCTASDEGESPSTWLSSITTRIHSSLQKHEWTSRAMRTKTVQSRSNCYQITRRHVIAVFTLTVETKSVPKTHDCPSDGRWIEKRFNSGGCYRMYLSTNISGEGLHSSWKLPIGCTWVQTFRTKAFTLLECYRALVGSW